MWETYNAVPERSVVPQDNILFLMRMCVDVLRLKDRTHDSKFLLVTARLESREKDSPIHE